MNKGKSQKRIDQILDAVIRCVAENGYQNLTMQNISKFSGLSKGAINHYFKKKEDILTALLATLDKKLFKMVDDKIKTSSDAKDYMRYRLSVTYDLAKNDPAFMYVITDFLVLGMNNPTHSKSIQAFLQKYRYLSGAGLRPGVKKGKFQEFNTKSIGAIIVALTYGIGIQYILDKKAFDYEEVSKIAEDMVMSYLEKKE